MAIAENKWRPFVPQGSKRLSTESVTCFAEERSVSRRVLKVANPNIGIEQNQQVIKRGISFLISLFLLFSCFVSAQDVDTAKFVLGKIEYSQHSEFVKIPVPYANREGMYMRKEALDAFIHMQKAAKADGIWLVIISAGRNFNHQKRIWEAKWNGTRKVGGKDLSQAIPDPAARAKEILKFSSMPGTSRHHWGTDIDINSLSPAYFNAGKGKKEYEWLRDHGAEFGFCQVYSEKGEERKYGYEEEKWHWSYVPIASVFTRYYMGNVGQQDIAGFDGSDALPCSEVLKYVDGIAEECR